MSKSEIQFWILCVHLDSSTFFNYWTERGTSSSSGSFIFLLHGAKEPMGGSIVPTSSSSSSILLHGSCAR